MRGGSRKEKPKSIATPNSTRPSHFIVPGKGNSAVKISAPSPSTGQDSEQLPDQFGSEKPIITQNVTSSQFIKNGISTHNLLNQGGNDAAEEVEAEIKGRSTEEGILPNDLQNHQHSFNQQPSISSHTLDIYAHNYVPLWLQAVNASAARVQPCLPLNSLSFQHYISTFAGSTFLQLCDVVDLPSISQGDTIEAPELCRANYQAYFAALLRNEITAEVGQLAQLSLYNTSFRTDNYAQHTFRLRVPGVRENAPPVNLGDVVAVRPLSTVTGPRISADAKAWLDSGACERGIYAPGFLGTEYHAVVWGISKAHEEVVLRVDGLGVGGSGAPHSCNVRFLLQQTRYVPLYRNLQSITLALGSTTPELLPWIRPMLFPNSSDAKVQKSLGKGRFDLEWISKDLNYEQQKAVNAVVEAGYGNVPYLISGPPGTGKTRTLVELALQLLKADRNAHLIVCSPSQSSADTLATRLSAHLRPKELFRLNSWTRPFVEVPDNLLAYSYSENDLFSLPDFNTMMSFKVIVTTCRDADLLIQARLTNQSLHMLFAGMLSSLLPEAQEYAAGFTHWTAVLVDEAAQATEPEALIPLSLVDPGVLTGKDASLPPSKVPLVVMAGDEYQLGPRLALSPSGSLHMSSFERLFRLPFYADHSLSRQRGNPPLKASMLPMHAPAFTNLVRNYRSHAAILSTPSVFFYHDTLVPERPIISQEVQNWHGWRHPTHWPVLFKQINDLDSVESILDGNGTGAGGLINPAEARTALQLAQSLMRHSSSNPVSEAPIIQQDILVMSPFRAQVGMLRTVFRAADLAQVNIGPLESFQGLEGRIVIVCTTRTRRGPHSNEARFVKEDQARGLGMIDEPKRFNVALTRAKEGLIVIGNEKCLTCTGDAAWKAFLAFCHRNGLVDHEHANLDRVVRDDDGKIGRLEKALNFAHTLESRTLGNDRRHKTNNTPGDNEMRGRIMNEDEQMWLNGMRMAEEDCFEADEAQSNGEDGPAMVGEAATWSRKDDSQVRRGPSQGRSTQGNGASKRTRI